MLVFLDSQVYIRSGFNFESPAFKRLKELSSQGLVTLITSQVVEEEVLGRLTDELTEALNGLRNFKRKATILQNTQAPNIKLLFSDINDQYVINLGVGGFKQYLNDCNATKLSADKVNPNTVLQLYFAKSPPFGKGKKKAEFPDAFNLLSLEIFAKEKRQDIHLVSEDKDLKNWAADSQNLIYVNSLEQFLDIFNKQYQEQLTKLLTESITNSSELMIRTIEDEIENIGYKLDSDWEAEVTYFEIRDITIQNLSVLKVSESAASISLSTDITYAFQVEGPDYNDAVFDKEEGYYLFFGEDKIVSDVFTEPHKVNIELNLEVVEGKVNITEIKTVEIENTKYGFAIDIINYEPY